MGGGSVSGRPTRRLCPLGAGSSGRVRRVAVFVSVCLAAGPAALGDPAPTYYDGVDATTPAALRVTLHETIDDHQRFPYTSTATDTWDILEVADEDAAAPAFIRDVYKDELFAKNGGGGGGYNREHTWPKSYGFPDDSQSNYPYTDCHHLFLSDDSYNSSRSNKPYGRCDAACSERPTVGSSTGSGGTLYPGLSNWTQTGLWETWLGSRGDVARALFYLDVRYEGGVHGPTSVAEPDLILTDDLSLVVTHSSNATSAYMGDLEVLLLWHLEDPVDDDERFRNDVVESYQGNRNPFIDHPEWVACLFAGQCNDGVAPPAPLGLQSAPAAEAVDLTWSPSPDPDVAGYWVWRADPPSGSYALLGPALVTADSYRDAQVESGVTYYYVVTAVDFAGNESPSSAEVAAAPFAASGGPWINELHYDNSGSDQGEGFEIAGAAGMDLAGWKVATYNGNGGTLTQQIDLTGVLGDDGSGSGFLWFAVAGLQNGPADGLALVDPTGTVREFLSYEGVVTAVDGPASGMTSQDIGVSESSSTAIGHSLQLTGEGTRGADFVWAASGPATPGAVNALQTLLIAPAVPLLSAATRVLVVGLLAGLALRRRAPARAS